MKEVFIPESQLIEAKEELPTVAQFREFREALSVAYASKPESKAFKFNQPSSISRQAFDLFSSGKKVPPEIAEFYYPDVPCPYDLTELSDDKLSELIQTFGPDIIRAKMVSKSVAEGNGVILPAGGACLFETFATDILKEGICKINPEVKAETAQKLIDNIPYYTQITGTMLMGGKARTGLMYREEFPWFLRAEKFGVEDALEQTVDSYDKIVAAQIRRGQLIDPRFSLITLPFSSLELEKEGLLREWFEMAVAKIPVGLRRRKPYVEGGYNLGWVRYTYGGPRILEVVRQRLETPGFSLDGATMHVRTKQLDHLGEDTYLLKDPMTLSWDSLKQLEKYETLFEVAIDSYLADSVDDPSIGFVGFDDFTVDGDIAHQTIFLETANGSNGKKVKIPRTREDVDEVLSSIVRLNANNLDEHLEFLDFIAGDNPEQASLMTSVQKLNRAIQSISEELLRISDGAKRTHLLGILTEKQAQVSQIPEDLKARAEASSRFPKASIMPISENLIVSHAIQLAFDSDMREFVCDAAFIETSNMPESDKKLLLMQKMREIMLKIRQYLTFIMRGGEYPSLRFTRIYTPIRH